MPVALVESLDREGRGVARADGKAVFIAGALPGERVEYTVHKHKPSYEDGTLTRLRELGLAYYGAGPARPADERRRYYQLTKSGRAALKVEVERMESLVRTARARRVATRPSRG